MQTQEINKTKFEKKYHDVVIIGAGISGLCAAQKLIEAGVDTIILEANDRVGGKIESSPTPVGGFDDMGAGYIGPTQNRVLNLIKKYDLKLVRIHDDPNEKCVMRLLGKRSTYASGAVPNVNLFSLLDINNMLVDTWKMGVFDINQNEPWRSKNAEYLDSTSVEEFLQQIGWTEEARQLVRLTLQCILSAEASEVSMLFWAWYMATGGGIFRRISNQENGPQGWYIQGGNDQLPQKIADSLGKNKIFFKHRVTHIEYKLSGDYKSRVWVLNPDSTVKCFYCKTLIVALSPVLYKTIQFNPVLPSLKNVLSQKMPIGTIIKCFIHYDKPYWRNNGYNGIILDDNGPVTHSMDMSDGKSFKLMGFILGNNARKLSLMDQNKRKKLVAEQFAKIFKIKEMRNPTFYQDKDWQSDTLTGGGYTGIFGPNQLTTLGPTMRKSVENIYFVCSELGIQWVGKMDGAVQSGQRIAHQILEVMSKQNSSIKHPGEFEVNVKAEILNKNEHLNLPKPTFIEKYIVPTPENFAIFVASLAAIGIYSFTMRPHL